MFEDHHESNNIHPTSAEEFRQSARYSFLLSKLRRLLTQFRHNRLTNVAWKFYWNIVLQKITQVTEVIPTQMRIFTLSRDFLHIH